MQWDGKCIGTICYLLYVIMCWCESFMIWDWLEKHRLIKNDDYCSYKQVENWWEMDGEGNCFINWKSTIIDIDSQRLQKQAKEEKGIHDSIIRTIRRAEIAQEEREQEVPVLTVVYQPSSLMNYSWITHQCRSFTNLPQLHSWSRLGMLSIPGILLSTTSVFSYVMCVSWEAVSVR